MSMNNTEFQTFLKKLIEDEKNVYIPVNSSLFEKIIHIDANCRNIHPNQDDEFCFPEVGPSYRIIGEYEKQFRDEISRGFKPRMEPLVVMKAHPKGFMLVNGHHRWAAALKIGMKKVPIKLVNMMMEEDIKRILNKSDHDKRVTLDLDEVVFRTPEDEYIEKTKGLLTKKSSKRIRLGIPALFRYLKSNGYDIWVYSSQYYSIDNIALMFKKYSVQVDGIISGSGKKGIYDEQKVTSLKELITGKYKTTIHIDNDMVVVTKGKGADFEEYEIRSNDELWSKDVIDLFEKMRKQDTDT
ncbi:ParB/RepB/Spo0J family partition protein [Butyrivibrio sp. VCB2006]|uniref:ParB/RepB/Spo0J family partition protein n=1 Tax=Butyrivibrio sp. VCB2006 TaxID=1280679 RepID=UPI000402DA10|nr:ParB/RepB/Spo0J family partition protein [Butyrivibrio sp. VCB2006]